jgi:imidazolonepropionase-like amidohydrolase
MMYDNGVEILSGTDIPNFGLVPGESLHHELELLVGAGISPLDVIKIACVNFGVHMDSPLVLSWEDLQEALRL